MNYWGAYCLIGWLIKDYSPTSYNFPYPEAKSVVGRWESRRAEHAKPLLVS